MMKQRIVKVGVRISVICIVVFLGVTIRKMLLLKSYAQKTIEFKNSDNHYEKVIDFSATNTSITELYCKDDKALMSTIKIEDSGETKIIRYFEEDRANIYMEHNNEKIVWLDTYDQKPDIFSNMDISFIEEYNWLELFQYALTVSIKNVTFNGKTCSVVTQRDDVWYYVDKEDGLVVLSSNGKGVDPKGKEVEQYYNYSYDRGVVTDEDLVKPDVSEYEIR